MAKSVIAAPVTAPGKAQDYFKELEKAVLGLRKQAPLR